jgi:hypothetical protein
MPLVPQEGQPIQGARISNGPEDFSLQYARLYLNNQTQLFTGDVKVVDPTVNQSLNCDHVINNADCGFGFEAAWSTLVTIKDITHNTPVGDKLSNADGEVGQGNPTISLGKVTVPTQYRIRVWANQDFGAAPPPSSQW